MFKIISSFKPTGDQPLAIKQLTGNIKAGASHQVLLGVTGSGKTFSIAKVIEETQKPALVISPNKTLAAQLYQEFREFFPNNAVHYFVSYYDYYQPEAYIPQTDTYIEKDAKVNEELDRLRHESTQDVLSRNDVIVIASVSCIYNIGSPESYRETSLEIKPGKRMKRKELLSGLISLQYQRNDYDFKPGAFRVRGSIIDIYLVTGKKLLRIELDGDKINKILISSAAASADYKPLTAKYPLYPAKFWVTSQQKLDIAIENIKLELQERLKELKKGKKLLEAQRLEQRTNYDLEMMKESGYCHGIENYSRHLEFRKPNDPPFTLIDYFRTSFGKNNFLAVIDESHLTVPQLRAMSIQDRIRKETLIEHGFRLPSALDNRPLTFEEFNKKVNQIIYASATPSAYEKNKSAPAIVEQLIRPTGLLEPSVEIRPAKNQIKDLIQEVEKTIKLKQRVLVVTITKRLAEDIAEHLLEKGIKTNYLHSEIKTLERPAILQALREGKYDVIVGINLLREGLDLPEVALVAILDADKEGFLRNETTLIQTMGRAARHPKGRVILYADKITGSIKSAMKEVKRRRKIQEEYNKEHDIVPKPIIKEIREWTIGKTPQPEDFLSLMELEDIKTLEKEMKKAAKELDFERAAQLRDLIRKLKNVKQ